MLVYRGESYDSVMSRRIPEVCAEPALQGIQVRVPWYDLETSRGQYNFRVIDEMYAALAACEKSLVVEVWVAGFNTTSTSGIVPSYILAGAEYNGGVAKTKSGYIARLWESPVMDRLIALYSAMAARYDSKPYFEAIIFTETATGSVADGYTATAWVTQIKRALVAMRSVWTSTNVGVFNNFIQGATDSQLSDVFETMRLNRIGTGAPDVLHRRTRQKERRSIEVNGAAPTFVAVYRRCSLSNHRRSVARKAHTRQSNYTTTALARMGAAICSGFATLIRVAPSRCGGTGIMPFLRSNPRTREACPTTYPGCGR